MNPFWYKLIGTLAAAGLFVLAHKFPDIAAELGSLAGGVVGGMWIPRPGDVKAEAPK